MLVARKANSEQHLTAGEISKVTGPLLDILYTIRKRPRDAETSLENKEAAMERLRLQYADEITSFGGDAVLADAWLEIVLLLEGAAQLASKDNMKIFGVVAQDYELAGGKIFDFQGFFDEKLRLHDYDLGRLKSREILRQLSGVINHGLSPNDDSDINIDYSLDDFNILASEEGSKYEEKVEQFVNRGFDYVASPVLRANQLRYLLSKSLGRLAAIIVFHPLLSIIAFIASGLSLLLLLLTRILHDFDFK